VRCLLSGRGWPPTIKKIPDYFDRLNVPLRIVDKHRPIADRDVPEADVLVATWWETANWAGTMARTKGARAYLIQQYEANFGIPHDQVDATWKLPFQKIVCAQWLADLARDRFGDATAIVCNNGIDISQFDASPRGKQKVPTVGLLHHASAHKGFDVGLATIAEARRSVPNLRVESYGTKRLPREVSLPPGSTYKRQPPQEMLRSIYANCDVWLCTSRSEGFHLPPHEAMACRCPVVSTRVGGPTELVEAGVNGHLADIDDSATLARHLIEVLDLPEREWKRMSDAAYETARRYTWEAQTMILERALSLAVERETSQQSAR
jgi:glycosyltransferase involved in cell wall biosynthesis